LASVHVPPQTAFQPWNAPGFISFDAKPQAAPEVVWSYWERVLLASRVSGKKPLHGALSLSQMGQEVVFKAMQNKPSGEGLFVFLIGDSHLRIVLSMSLMAMSRDPLVLKAAGYNRQTFHLPHLFCCPRTGMTSPEAPFARCTIEIGEVAGVHHEENREQYDAAIANRTRAEGGQFCVFWELQKMFWQSEETSTSAGALTRWSSAGKTPDLLVINGGAHYSDFDNSDRSVTGVAYLTRTYERAITD
jgi:hypothetical protein